MCKCDICDTNDGIIKLYRHTVCDSCKTKYQPEIDKLLEKTHELEEKGQKILDLSKDVANQKTIDRLLEDVLQMDLLEAAYVLMFVVRNVRTERNYLLTQITQKGFQDKLKMILPYENNDPAPLYIVSETYNIRRQQP